jgi:hypothetical protein
MKILQAEIPNSPYAGPLVNGEAYTAPSRRRRFLCPFPASLLLHNLAA